jgi:hypothetical protein
MVVMVVMMLILVLVLVLLLCCCCCCCCCRCICRCRYRSWSVGSVSNLLHQGSHTVELRNAGTRDETLGGLWESLSCRYTRLMETHTHSLSLCVRQLEDEHEIKQIRSGRQS